MVKSDTGNDPNIKPIIKTLDISVLFKITTKNLKKKLLAEIAKDEPKLEKRNALDCFQPFPKPPDDERNPC